MYIKASAASWEMRFSSSPWSPVVARPPCTSPVCLGLYLTGWGLAELPPGCVCGILAELQPCSPGISSCSAWKC